MPIYKSSEWAERAFCKVCGSVALLALQRPDEYSFCAGTLDDQSALELTTEIFIDEKPTNYAFANETQEDDGRRGHGRFMAGRQIGDTRDD